MRVDFFVSACQEYRNNSLFGLCDDNDGKKAYTDLTNERNWIATVKNDRNKQLVFTAIDKCVIQDFELPGRGRCDGLLTSDEHIFFIELKDKAMGWMTEAVEQLESTIQLFKENHDISIYKHKKAFACNKQHKHFQEIDNEFNLLFFRKNKVRIDIQADVIVV